MTTIRLNGTGAYFTTQITEPVQTITALLLVDQIADTYVRIDKNNYSSAYFHVVSVTEGDTLCWRYPQSMLSA